MGPRAVPILTAAYGDKDAGVRGWAVKAAGQIGTEAQEILFSALSDENRYVALDAGELIAALDALGFVWRPTDLEPSQKCPTARVVRPRPNSRSAWPVPGLPTQDW